MITRSPRMRAFLAYSATISGSRCADITRTSCRMPRSVSSLAAFSMAGMSDLEPMTMPTRGASTVQALELGLDFGFGGGFAHAAMSRR